MNISVQEVAALFELAARAPKTVVEQLWFDNLAVRWNQAQQALVQSPAGPEEEPEEEPETSEPPA